MFFKVSCEANRLLITFEQYLYIFIANQQCQVIFKLHIDISMFQKKCWRYNSIHTLIYYLMYHYGIVQSTPFHSFTIHNSLPTSPNHKSKVSLLNTRQGPKVWIDADISLRFVLNAVANFLVRVLESGLGWPPCWVRAWRTTATHCLKTWGNRDKITMDSKNLLDLHL